MARPYSLHLPNPIIKAHQEGKFSIRQIAQRFQGCPPRARNWSESESLHHLSTTRKAEAKPEKKLSITRASAEKLWESIPIVEEQADQEEPIDRFYQIKSKY